MIFTIIILQIKMMTKLHHRLLKLIALCMQLSMNISTTAKNYLTSANIKRIQNITIKQIT